MGRHAHSARILTALLASPVPVLAQDPIAANKAAAAIADQKADAEVAQAIADAEKVAANSKPKAVERLKQASTALDLSVTIGSKKREELIARIQSKIDILEGRKAATVVEVAAGKLSLDAKTAVANAKQETEDVTKGIRQAADLHAVGRDAEAKVLLNSLAAKYPINPSVQALQGTGYTSANLTAYKQLQQEYAEAWVADQRAVMASGIPTTDDIKFPKKDHWKQITELRRTANKIKLTEKEESILKSLNTVVQVVVKDRPFQEAIQEFSNQIKQDIHIDIKSLEDSGQLMNQKVTFQGSVSARTALRAILQGQGLTYVVKDEMIQVVTLEKAERDMLTTRSYDIGDLVDSAGQFGNAVQWGPALSFQQMAQNADSIVKLIEKSIDPRCWKEAGGFCTVTFHLPTRQLVVRASTEVHAAIGGSFTGKK